jgi:predicted transcriptional regulator
MSMQMTDDEIRAMYRQAKDKEKEIGILAELNACKSWKIRAILGQDAEAPGRHKGAEMEPRIRPLADSGMDDGQIGAALGISAASVKYYRKKYDITGNGTRGVSRRRETKTMKKDNGTAETSSDSTQQKREVLPSTEGTGQSHIETEGGTAVHTGMSVNDWYERELKNLADNCSEQAELVRAYRTVLLDVLRSRV